MPAPSDAVTANGILVTTNRPRKTEKTVTFAIPDEFAGLKAKSGNDSMSLEDLVKAIATKLAEEESEKADLQEDNNKKTLALGMVERDSEAVAKRAAGSHVQMLKYKGRLSEYGADREDQVPTNVAELTEILSKTQDAYQHLEVTKKGEFMAMYGDFVDYKRLNEASIADMQANLDNKEVELVQVKTSRDFYKQQQEDVLARLSQSSSVPDIIAAFQAKEAHLVQEKDDAVEAKNDIDRQLNECRSLYATSHVECGRVERELQDEKAKNTQLASQVCFLEARAEPVEFIGLPRDQRLEMERKETERAEAKEEARLLKETMRNMAITKG